MGRSGLDPRMERVLRIRGGVAHGVQVVALADRPAVQPGDLVLQLEVVEGPALAVVEEVGAIDDPDGFHRILYELANGRWQAVSIFF